MKTKSLAKLLQYDFYPAIHSVPKHRTLYNEIIMFPSIFIHPTNQLNKPTIIYSHTRWFWERRSCRFVVRVRTATTKSSVSRSPLSISLTRSLPSLPPFPYPLRRSLGYFFDIYIALAPSGFTFSCLIAVPHSLSLAIYRSTQLHNTRFHNFCLSHSLVHS